MFNLHEHKIDSSKVSLLRFFVIICLFPFIIEWHVVFAMVDQTAKLLLILYARHNCHFIIIYEYIDFFHFIFCFTVNYTINIHLKTMNINYLYVKTSTLHTINNLLLFIYIYIYIYIYI